MIGNLQNSFISDTITLVINMVNIKELAELFDCISDDWHNFVDKRSGEIVSIQDSYFYECEEEVDMSTLLDWECDEVRKAVMISKNFDNYVPFPSKWDINHYCIIEEFITTIGDDIVRENLYDSIKGKGAFRRFKYTLVRFGLLEQ